MLAEWNYPCVNFLNFAVSSNEMQGKNYIQIKMESFTITKIFCLVII